LPVAVLDTVAALGSFACCWLASCPVQALERPAVDSHSGYYPGLSALLIADKMYKTRQFRVSRVRREDS